MRNFDLAVTLKSTGVKGETKEFSFNLIDRAEYKPLLDFLLSKKLTVKNPIVSFNFFLSAHFNHSVSIFFLFNVCVCVCVCMYAFVCDFTNVCVLACRCVCGCTSSMF